MEWAGFCPGRCGVEMKKPSKIEGLGERETGFEQPTADLPRNQRVGGFGFQDGSLSQFGQCPR